jgi:hypothetical protein
MLSAAFITRRTKLLVPSLLLCTSAPQRGVGLATTPCRRSQSWPARCGCYAASIRIGIMVRSHFGLLDRGNCARRIRSKRCPFPLDSTPSLFGLPRVVVWCGSTLTNQVSVKDFRVQVALDGDAPWGTVDPEWTDTTKPLVLYRRVGDTYCYVAFKSTELRDRLAAKNGSAVSMQINVLRSFGKEYGYNVRSVDGLLLANGTNVVREAERFGGQVLGPSGSSPEPCW